MEHIFKRLVGKINAKVDKEEQGIDPMSHCKQHLRNNAKGEIKLSAQVALLRQVLAKK